jgi:hypothetical protein
VALYPVQYQPGAERILFAPELTVHVTTRPRATPVDVLPYRGLRDDVRELSLRLDNPGLLDEYEPASLPKGEPVDYLVIAPQRFHAKLQEYVAHKAELFGLRCEIAAYEDILETATGNNPPAKVRNYLKERYADGVQWVLIVGDADRDAEVVELRPLYVTGVDPDDGTQYTDSAMASDQYYGCLDGNYNFNGNGRWGEPNDGLDGGEVDLLYDVHVGRFTVEEPWELNVITGKTVAFEDDVTMPWRLLFVGEYADEVTEGGDLKDKVYEYCGDQTIPLRTLYDRDGTLTHNALVTAINNNKFQWLNHIGHADVAYNMGFTPSMVAELTNTRMYLGFSQGCFSGSVDGVDAYGSWGYADCMAEQFTHKRAGGAFAYFMNTRYGFYLRGRVDGPSNVYDWELADAFFNDGIPHIGAAMDKAKEDCIGQLSPNNMMRWSWYTLFLFGDPQTPMRLNCDNDQDGFVSAYCKGGDDCRDTDPAVSPAAEEICDDGVDNDCNGLVDADDPACASPPDDDDDATDDDVTDDDDDTGGSADDDDNNDSGGCG